jgi:hypothetical protein
MIAVCKKPLGLGELAAYRVGELDAGAEQAIEEHYFGCAECSDRLAWLDSLATSTREALRAGSLSANVTSSWVTAAAASGVRIRTYQIAPGGTVHCTIAPAEDFVVVRLRVDDPSPESFDADIEVEDLSSGTKSQHEITGMSLDLESQELVYAFSGETARGFPRTLWTIHVRAHGRSERLGRYTMDHTPWDQLAEPR